MKIETQMLIDRLTEINDLKNEIRHLDFYVDQWIMIDARNQCCDKRTELGPLKDRPAVFDCTISPGISALDMLQAQKPANFSKKWFKITGIASIVSILMIMLRVAFFYQIGGVALFLTACFGYASYTYGNDYKEKTKKYNEAQTKFNQSFTNFCTALSQYDEQVQKGIEAAKEHAERYDVFYNQVKEIEAAAEKELAETKAKLYEARTRFNEICDIPDQYLHFLENIIGYLQTGRADDYKEALNLAIQEEREAELRAQQEAHNRAMLAQQLAAAEAQRRHNEAMEAQAALQSKIASDAAAEARRQQRDQQQAALEQRRREESQTRDQCNRCANKPCGMMYQRPNCAAFRPR